MDRVFGWLRIAGHRGWQLGGVAVGVFVLWQLFQKLMLLVLVVFIALLITALLLPVSTWLERRGLPASAAAAVTVVGGTAMLFGVGWLITVQIMGQVSELTRQFEQVRESFTTWLTQGPLDLSQQQIENYAEQATETIQQQWGRIASSLVSVVVAIGGFLTALVLAFFLIRDSQGINRWLLNRVVAADQQALVRAAAERAGATLQNYIQAVVIIGTLDAFFIGIALVVMGVPLAVPLAVLTFFGAFFPVVGATVAGFLAAGVATVSGGIVQGLIVVAVVIVVQQIDGNILQPVIMGRAVHLHPAVVLVVLTAGALLAGIVGAFLAVPFTAVAVAAGAEFRERRDNEAVESDQADQNPSDAHAHATEA